MTLAIVRYYRRRQDTESGASSTKTEDALEELRQRYAQDELSEEAFERRVKRLLKTESIEDAQNYVDRQERKAHRRVRVNRTPSIRLVTERSPKYHIREDSG